MKKTFSNKYFDLILIVITGFFTIEAVLNLRNSFEFFSSFLPRIIFVLTSIFAFTTLIMKNGNGEKYSLFFIIINLIMPDLLILNLYITDLIIYGINRLSLLQNSILHLKFFIGIIFFILTIKYSRQSKLDRLNNYGILISFFGIFLVILILIKTVEPNFNIILNNTPIWKTIVKTIIGLLIVYLGYCLRKGSIKLKNSIILTLTLMFIYGLI